MRVPDQEFYEIALKEFRLLESFEEGHENVMKVQDIFYNKLEETMYIVMEYLGEGFNLHSYLKNIQGGLRDPNSN
jgi:serine/threonine protein kinase